MKKSLFIVILFFSVSHLLNAQPACIKDVIYSLVSLKEVPKARKMMEEQCFPGNESSADVWLVRANVFIQLYDYENERKIKDPKYVHKWPDAIIISNESFYKALELKPDIKASVGLLDPKDGQLLSAYPISELASKAMEKKDYTEAIRLLNIVIRSYKADPKGYAQFLAYAYLDLSNCYKAIGDDANNLKLLQDASKLNVPEPEIYLNLYDIYRQSNDTVKCGEIINQARRVIPDSLAINLRSYELDYYNMVGDTLKLKTAAVKMYEQYTDNLAVINIVAGHLVNNKEYLTAQEIIEAGLAIDSNSFELNQQMTYRYYYEAADYDDLKNEQLKLKKYLAAKDLLDKSNEILEVAAVWAEKAYNIYKEDKEHNIMFRQILVRLMLPVSDELQTKVDSYYQH